MNWSKLAGWLGILGALSLPVMAQDQTEMKGIVPGDALHWEVQQLEVSVVVTKPTELELQIFSPGFDPDDYRNALKGGPQLGDERYDKEQGQIVAQFDLSHGKTVLQQQTFGVEKNRWVNFYKAPIQPGIYSFTSRLMGLGKNAFRLKANSSVSGAVTLMVNPALRVIEGRSVSLTNIFVMPKDRGTDWVEPITLDVSPDVLPLKVGFYDEDGSKELQARVQLPDGTTVGRPVSGDLEWSYYQILQSGLIKFGFTQSPQAQQYSNTVGFWVDGCLEMVGDTYKAVPPRPVVVTIVDAEGKPVSVPYELEGRTLRNLKLGQLPKGWQVKEVTSEGADTLEDGRLRFSCAGGEAKFVLQPTQPEPTPVPAKQPGWLEVRAVLVLPSGEQSYDLPLQVDGKNYRLSDGQMQLELTPAAYTLAPVKLAAKVEGPSQAEVVAGQTTQVLYRIYPQVQLSLEADRKLVYVGEQLHLTAHVQTEFADLLPIDLALQLPECLQSDSTLRKVGSVSASHEVTLTLLVTATCKGDWLPQALLSNWNQQAQVAVKVIQPARFTLSKTVDTSEVAAGGAVNYSLKVVNTGDEAGEIRLIDELPLGLEGDSIDQPLRLEAGQEQLISLPARVKPNAPDLIINTAKLLNTAGGEAARAEATLKVLHPKATLTRSLDKPVVIPGEEVLVSLTVGNTASVGFNYTLVDSLPEWLEPLEPVSFRGNLTPGQQATHTYRAKVIYGPPTKGSFQAKLDSAGGNLVAADEIQRVLLGLEKRVEPEAVVLGNPAEFVLKLSNPLNRPIELDLREVPDPNLGMELPGLNFKLEANETRELRLPAKPTQIGDLENQAVLLVGETIASARASATLKVLPLLEPRRISTITLDFKVVKGQGDRLLLTHSLPKDSSYELGSARLNNNPIPDPKVDAEGRLYFELPFQGSGVVTYQVTHREVLGPLEKSTLTLRSGDREIFLQGNVPFADANKGKPMVQKPREGLIRFPVPGTVFRTDKTKVVLETPNKVEIALSVNGEEITSRNVGLIAVDPNTGQQRLEYYGIPLKPGHNLIEARSVLGVDRIEVFMADNPTHIEVSPLRLLADGRTPIELEIRVVDAFNLTNGFGPLTVESSLEPLDPDAFPRDSGYQVLVRDGVARLRLKPLATPGTITLRMMFDQLQGSAEFFAVGKQGSLGQLQASLGVRIGDSIQVFGLARGYLETPFQNGLLQGAVDGAVRFNQGNPNLTNGLAPQPTDATAAYPLTGSGTEAQMPLRSDDPVALRYDQTNFSLSYRADTLKAYGLSGLPQGTALQVESRGELSVQGFAGYLPAATLTDEIVPDGTRLYKISQPAQNGSEVVYLMVGNEQIPLVRLKDYVLDGPSGLLTLARPLWPDTSDFQNVRIRVTYSPASAARAAGYGAGVQYKKDGFSVGAGAAFLPDSGWRYGLEAGYQTNNFTVRGSYAKGLSNRFGFLLNYRGDALQSQANFSYETQLQGQAQVQINLTGQDSIALEHQATGQENRSGVLYQRRVSSGFSVGAGLGYTWETLSTNLLARLAYDEQGLNASLTHAQPFSLSLQALTRLQSTYAFDPNLSFVSDLSYTWGASFAGTVGLKQKLAGANLSLDYQLPGASGEGNRARFGLEAPLPLDDYWSLNLQGGYEYGFTNQDQRTAFGLAVRYQNKTLSATLGGETSLTNGDPKVVIRGGATGQIDDQQSVSVDATYQVAPTLQGAFTAAYALRATDFDLLTYHRLVTAAEQKLEGGIASSYVPNTSFQLRPSMAYLVPLAAPESYMVQFGLGGNWYFTDWLGVGGSYYRLLQNGDWPQAFSLEASVRVLEGLWFNLGYTFGGFTGLTPDTSPGFYLRFDYLGGMR